MQHQVNKDQGGDQPDTNIVGKSMRLMSRPHQRRAFARTELAVVLAVTALLGVLLVPFFAKLGVKSHTAGCLENLRQMGNATGIYTRDNSEKLPYAYILYTNQRQTSWDALLGRYLGGGQSAPKGSVPGAANPEAAKVFQCPSDKIPTAAWAQKYKMLRRSYSLPRHDMHAKNWPPGALNETGIGLWWAFGPKGDKPPSQRIYNFQATNAQAAVTMSMLLMPAKVMIATEQITSNNIAAVGSRAFITRTLDHCDTNSVSLDYLHNARFNYLLGDGHVETLLPEETVGPTGKAGQYVTAHKGIWTIRIDD